MILYAQSQLILWSIQKTKFLLLKLYNSLKYPNQIFGTYGGLRNYHKRRRHILMFHIQHLKKDEINTGISNSYTCKKSDRK